MRIALDATYSLSDEPSGVAVYSRQILEGLAASGFADAWEWFYRSQRYWKAQSVRLPGNVKRRFLTDTWGSRAADLFHGLNQRLPDKPFRRQIATFHDLFVMSGDYSTKEFRDRFTAQARQAAAAADLIVAVSAFTARQVEDLLGFPASRIRVIHHGVLRRRIPELPRENVVLCVGAIQKRKNQSALVRAFRALPADWTLVLAGSEGYEASETMSEIAKSPCAGRIRVTGYLSEAELTEWYARARIFAFPSHDEGFGMPVLEAMAAGLPVIAGARSALTEAGGEAVLYVDPRKDDEIAATLNRLASDAMLRQELIDKGHARVREFTWQRSCQATLDAYREVLS
ncbi:MAG TPA: glycosyltransferase family 1 protein [Bryobacteraceae bacterium]|nr:glycosyltransferase family 1 protein [Bryobacteraceae bacterium]